MYKLKMATAVILLSMTTSTEMLAQSFSEPAAFESQHPDRDVLNGGVLTPAARTAAGLESLGAAYRAVGVLTRCLRTAITRGIGFTVNSCMVQRLTSIRSRKLSARPYV